MERGGEEWRGEERSGEGRRGVERGGEEWRGAERERGREGRSEEVRKGEGLRVGYISEMVTHQSQQALGRQHH